MFLMKPLDFLIKALDMIVYKLLLEQTPRERVQLMKW